MEKNQEDIILKVKKSLIFLQQQNRKNKIKMMKQEKQLLERKGKKTKTILLFK